MTRRRPTSQCARLPTIHKLLEVLRWKPAFHLQQRSCYLQWCQKLTVGNQWLLAWAITKQPIFTLQVRMTPPVLRATWEGRCGSLLGQVQTGNPWGLLMAVSGLQFLPLTNSSHHKQLPCSGSSLEPIVFHRLRKRKKEGRQWEKKKNRKM